MSNKIICIGREYGSGGREIGEKLSEKLGIVCYDKLLLQKAANDSGISFEQLKYNDEKPINTNVFIGSSYLADIGYMANTFYNDSINAYNAQRSAIISAAKSPCIIIGRCASHILKDMDNVLSVFIYADTDDKIKRVAKRNNIDEKAALARIKKTDKMRKKYFDFYADTSWGSPESYDLMISSSKYGIDGCVEIIARAFEI